MEDQVKTEEMVELAQAVVASVSTNEAVAKQVKEAVVPVESPTTTIVASTVGNFSDF